MAKYRVKMMANRVGRSERQFRRDVREHFGVSAKLYLGALQVNVGVNCLIAGAAIERAAAKAGYKTVPHFARQVREYLGVTPRQLQLRYRKIVRFR